MAIRSTNADSGESRSLANNSARLQSHSTSFGWKEVREEEKEKLIGDVFTKVAKNYDLLNDLMSFGLHRSWKNRLVSKLEPFPGMKHLDVAGGTGDVAFRVLEAINLIKLNRSKMDYGSSDMSDTEVFVCDINLAMLNAGKTRAFRSGLAHSGNSLFWVEGDAECLSFDSDSMDGYTVAFGIRNMTHIDKALAEAYRVLKRGGKFLCLEFSHLDNPIFKKIYDLFSFYVIPRMGQFITGDRDSYQYLVESIRRFPAQATFAGMIEDAGFQNVEYENLLGGVVAIHSGIKL